MHVTYKFQKLNVYHKALNFAEGIYQLSFRLPDWENYNLGSQVRKAATSIVLNIAEGSTGQTNLEQHRFLGLALRSFLESIACLDMIENRGYLKPSDTANIRYEGHVLFMMIIAFRKKLSVM